MPKPPLDNDNVPCTVFKLILLIPKPSPFINSAWILEVINIPLVNIRLLLLFIHLKLLVEITLELVEPNNSSPSSILLIPKPPLDNDNVPCTVFKLILLIPKPSPFINSAWILEVINIPLVNIRLLLLFIHLKLLVEITLELVEPNNNSPSSILLMPKPPLDNDITPLRFIEVLLLLLLLVVKLEILTPLIKILDAIFKLVICKVFVL